MLYQFRFLKSSTNILLSPTSAMLFATIHPNHKNTHFVLRHKVSCILRFPIRCGILYRCKLVQYPLGKFHRNHHLSHSRNCTYHHCHNHQMMYNLVPLNEIYKFYAQKYFPKLFKSNENLLSLLLSKKNLVQGSRTARPRSLPQLVKLLVRNTKSAFLTIFIMIDSLE